jgi:hypothetical protein
MFWVPQFPVGETIVDRRFRTAFRITGTYMNGYRCANAKGAETWIGAITEQYYDIGVMSFSGMVGICAR